MWELTPLDVYRRRCSSRPLAPSPQPPDRVRGRLSPTRGEGEKATLPRTRTADTVTKIYNSPKKRVLIMQSCENYAMGCLVGISSFWATAARHEKNGRFLGRAELLRAVCVRISGLIQHRTLGVVQPAVGIPYSRAKTALTGREQPIGWVPCALPSSRPTG